MNVAFRVQQNIIRLHVSVYDSLLVYVSQGTTQLGYPESNCFFSKGLSRNVKSQVATVH
jgi:hypothetical protein